jgi:hypothetical protein
MSCATGTLGINNSLIQPNTPFLYAKKLFFTLENLLTCSLLFIPFTVSNKLDSTKLRHTNMINDIIMLIAGVILGFGASISTIKYQELIQKKRALKICKIELFKINKLIAPFTVKDNQIKTPDGEIIKFNGISMTETPNFRMVTQIEMFLNLNDTLRKSIYDISLDLESAENNRKLAIPLLNQENRTNELFMYGTIYTDYLKSALDKIDKLKMI